MNAADAPLTDEVADRMISVDSFRSLYFVD